jgi:hypothetical protein
MQTIFLSVLAFASGTLALLIFFTFYLYTVEFAHGPSSEIEGVNILEVTYFIGNTIVAIVTPIVFIFAIRQFKHTEQTGRASVYLDISNRYNSDSIRYARQQISKIKHAWSERKLNGTLNGETLESFGNRIMVLLHDERKKFFLTSSSQSEYDKIIVILSFIEHLGVLADRKYIDKNDLFDLMCGTIQTTEDVLKNHIKWIRNERDRGSPNTFANALWLMEKARKNAHKMNFYDKGEYRIPTRATIDYEE